MPNRLSKIEHRSRQQRRFKHKQTNWGKIHEFDRDSRCFVDFSVIRHRDRGFFVLNERAKFFIKHAFDFGEIIRTGETFQIIQHIKL